MIHRLTIFFLAFIATVGSYAQDVHPQSSQYEWPQDSLVRQKLEAWRDLKFGMIIHWGLYAVPGIVESWQLCSEEWIDRDSTMAYDEFKKWYWGLKKDFNPTKFNPDQWALAGRDAGMRYVVFTTKHHDGFNMFDTQYSDFKITSGPFAGNPKANVARHVFDAFRKQDFMIGAYYSKPDWHSEYFWWPKYATPDRNVNYDIRKHAWRWNQFKQYTHNQLNELMTQYGKIDILWLDGGWVRPLETVTDEVRAWGAPIPLWSQHIDIPAVAEKARKTQPGLLVVDRTVHGAYENYQTPEQSVPKVQLAYPWESCITLGGAWGYVANDKFKSSTQVIHTLIEVVSKGGNLLLGVGPTPEGLLLDEQIARLKEIGKWLEVNGEAIYGSRTVSNYRSGDTFFTRGKTGTTYALTCVTSGAAPATVKWKGNLPKPGSKVRLLGKGKTVRWSVKGDEVTVSLPRGTEVAAALVFAYKPADQK